MPADLTLPARVEVASRKDRSPIERAFLPAVLEIEETPASPAGRAIGALIILFLLIAIAWASFGRVEIVASATGKIVPTGRTKVIQPFEEGLVRAIHVQEGQSVKAGDVVIELDPTAATAERDRLRNELIAAQLDVARLTAVLASDADPAAALVAPDGASEALVELARRLATAALAEHHAKLAELDRELARAGANYEAVSSTIDKLNAALPLLRDRAEVRRYLYDHQYGSKLTYLETQQQLVEMERDLVVQRDRLSEADAARQGILAQKNRSDAEFRHSVLEDMTKAQDKADSLAQELVKAEQRMQQQTLAAPVDGIVQQLAVHTVGGVVTPAQTLMVIVPADSRLEIEAMVSNQDIGFVHAGQLAEIKVGTFNFTRYGLLHGTVESVSRDAVTPDAATQATTPSERGNAQGQTAVEPRVPELAYAARISLDRAAMDIDGRTVDLKPGMVVTVEIKTGTRRVIDYLLSPLLRYRQDSLRER